MNHHEESRSRALAEYSAHPNRCLHCQQVIGVPDGIKVSEVRKKKFCRQSCAASYNNQRRTRRSRPRQLKKSLCRDCGCLIPSRRGLRKLCDRCLLLFRLPGGVAFPDRTKGDLFAQRSHWQSARCSIREHASQVYRQSGLPLQCFACGYNLHVEIAYRRPVSDFPSTATMREINALSNLVALCRNHHWELDQGLLVLNHAEGSSAR
jgi:HNH endonuclease